MDVKFTRFLQPPTTTVTAKRLCPNMQTNTTTTNADKPRSRHTNALIGNPPEKFLMELPGPEFETV
jgi:hypothetical protein